MRVRIAAQPQNPLQPQSAGTVFLTGQMPDRPKPKLERLARVVENRSGGGGNWIQAAGAHSSLPIHRPGATVLTPGADKTLRPTQLDQILLARLLGGETSLEIQLIPRIILVHDPKPLGIAGTVVN